MPARMPEWDIGFAAATPLRSLLSQPGAGRRRAPWGYLGMRLIGSLVAAGLLALAGAAHAQPGTQMQAGVQGSAAASEASGAPPGWQFSVTPYLWLPALRGTLQTPLPRIGDPSSEISSGAVLTNLARVPVMLAGEARYGRFALVGDFVYAGVQQDINTRGIGYQNGHSILVSTFGTLLGMVRAVETPSQSFEIGGGVRVWNFDVKLSLNPGARPGAIGKGSSTWADPIVAARYGAMLSPRFGTSIYADIGGFDTGSRLTWQVVGSLDYAVTDSTVVRAGWRYLNVDRTRGSFGVDLGFNGPFLAGTFRF